MELVIATIALAALPVASVAAAYLLLHVAQKLWATILRKALS